jgi:DNA ligase 1
MNTMLYFTFIILFFVSLTVNATLADNLANIPPLLMANNFHQQISLDEYWVSEKYDGVRAYWNGKQLVSRNGHAFTAPEWFTRDFPSEPLDGELWLARSSFDELSGIARTDNALNEDWKKLQYMVFDAPANPQPFDQRLQHLQQLLGNTKSPYIQCVKQWKVDNMQQLQQQLQAVVDDGGEGLMLHRGSSFYKAERSDDLLKLKLFDDAEAVVVRHIPGKGKFREMMGSMEVVTRDGQHFRIGTGFSDADRQNPPAKGSTITYRFNGLTRKGLPRFPRFLRKRNEW